MFRAQARLTPGFHVAVVADLNVEKALQALTTTGWAKEQFAARGLDDALKSGATWVTDDAGAIFKTEAIEVVIDATGHPPAGIRSEEHTSELQSLMRISYAVFCLKKKNKKKAYAYW